MKIKIGILGAGGIAEKMAFTLSRMENAECSAIGSRSLEKASYFAEKHGIKKAYGSYLELAADSGLDLIYIATPHSHHYEHALLCLNAGRNILVEKAFMGNARQAKEVLKLAEEKKLLAAEAIWTRYLPLQKKLEELLGDGIIGETFSLSANLGYSLAHIERVRNPALAGGALLDLGVYVINFALMVFGSDIEKTESTATLMETGMDIENTVNITFSNKKTASLCSRVDMETDRKGIIKGEKGWIEFENINCCEWIKVHLNSGETIRFDPPPQISGFEFQVEACRRALESGETQCPEMPHSEIIRVMEIMDSLRKEWGVVYPFD